MSWLFLGAFVAGLLLAVRIMFFGAERRRRRFSGGMPLRRSEPAASAFLIMFGLAGYLLTRRDMVSSGIATGLAVVLGVVWASLVTKLAIVTTRMRPGHDPDDPRYVLQGHVALVVAAIPAGGEGTIACGAGDARRILRARSIDAQAVGDGLEVCIERVDDGVAYVERWALVEARL